MHVDRLSMGFSILYLILKFLYNYDALLSRRLVFIFANSAGPDEMPHYATFHLGPHFFLSPAKHGRHIGIMPSSAFSQLLVSDR